MSDAIAAATSMVGDRWGRRPKVGVILGTGLGGFVEEMLVEADLPYECIPHMPRPTAIGHEGHLVCGRMGSVPIAVMQGRCHFYEGCSPDELTRPVRLLAALGAELLIVSNASGGLNPRMLPGELMVVSDHINLMGRLAMTHAQPTLWVGRRRPVYDESLIDRTCSIARSKNIALHRGAYVGVVGPNYETRAEYRAFRRLGGDVVGMSTIPEVLAASHCGMKVLAIATITNLSLPDAPRTNDAEAVVGVASAAEPKLRRLVGDLIRGLQNPGESRGSAQAAPHLD